MDTDLDVLYYFNGVFQQFHFRKANAFLVGLPFSSFIGPLTPDIREQNDFLLLAAFEPGFNLDGGVVTAIAAVS